MLIDNSNGKHNNNSNITITQGQVKVKLCWFDFVGDEVADFLKVLELS